MLYAILCDLLTVRTVVLSQKNNTLKLVRESRIWVDKQHLISFYIGLFVTIQHSNAKANIDRMYSQLGRRK